MSTNFGIFLFENAEELDWAGPWEVLAAWSKLFQDDDIQVFTVARDTKEIQCAKGLRVIADHTWETAPPIDVLVFPGGFGVRAFEGDEGMNEWLRTLSKNGTLVTSVCTGALVLAQAGLLDGRPATTWWGALETLPTLGQDIEVRPEDRYVDSGEVITAAGVSAGIDMALHLVVRYGSVERAKDVKRYIQYDPAPPV